jgi:cation diffusion facilitator CzcD-associated flavoprotein CzcO
MNEEEQRKEDERREKQKDAYLRLDSRVYDKLFGQQPNFVPSKQPTYSTNVGDNRAVEDWLEANGWTTTTAAWDDKHERYTVVITNGTRTVTESGTQELEAICRAFLGAAP